ncbi:MoxR-like ATPase [Nonlabens dokdonensis]|jgi:MoxR-like ATPase|uniref:MoxR-like ATPase n=2 Tax=Nonlabens dokdonensis TaxID=328515 RepID=A0ABX5Q101_9FLAO|nr:AAA family ATPase [Nonlabens dokdonensis]AGC75959.1 putative ATPase [Nonlabens dokdonensis DSW-6]PZX43636.1 MoxR-like ATPase [Nonlabens dokdonensis]
MRKHFEDLLGALNKDLYEREQAIRLTLLTVLSGQSIFLLGKPGVAKSLIARRIKEVFKDATAFEYLMNRFSTPDEIFGPVAISKLKSDTYERAVKGYLPDADIAFLDEIWKAGPSIQNTLLTIINEKLYRNGSKDIKVPLKGLIAASNELPDQGQGLEALWDRFIVRISVKNIAGQSQFSDYLMNAPQTDFKIDPKLQLSTRDYEMHRKKASQVKVLIHVVDVVLKIKNYINLYNNDAINEHKIYVSDRRWKKIIEILKTSAYLNDRKAIDATDCFLIRHMIWDHPSQENRVLDFVTEAILNHGLEGQSDLADWTSKIERFKTMVVEKTTFFEELTKEVLVEREIDDSTYIEFVAKENPTDDIAIQKEDWDQLTTFFEQLYYYDGNRAFRGDFKKYGKNVLHKRLNSWNNDFISYRIQMIKENVKKKTRKKPNDVISKNILENHKSLTKEFQKLLKSSNILENKDTFDNLFVSQHLTSMLDHPLSKLKSQTKALEKQLAQIKVNYDKLK